MKMYVGNLDFQTTETELRKAFRVYGPVSAAKVMRNDETGYSRGFGFIEMKNPLHGQAALVGMEGFEMHGRGLLVRPEKANVYESDAVVPRRMPRR